MNNYSFFIKKNYRWLMIICSLMNSNLINSSHELSAGEEAQIEQERQSIDNGLKDAQKQREDMQRKYDEDKQRIDDMRKEDEKVIDDDLKFGRISKETADSKKQSLDNNVKFNISALDRNFINQQDDLIKIINTLKERKDLISPNKITDDVVKNELAEVEKAKNDMKKMINNIDANFKVFEPALKGNKLTDDQYFPVIVMAAEFKRSINNDFYVGRVTDDQQKRIEELKVQADAMIKQAYTKILLRLDAIIKDNTVKSADVNASINAVQDAINQLYGLNVKPSNNPTDEEDAYIKEGKELLNKFNEKIKNTTETSLAYYKALLEFKEALVNHLHGHRESINDLIDALNKETQSNTVKNMINGLKDDQNDLDQLSKRYQLDVDLGIKFITREIGIIINEVDESFQREFYNEKNNLERARHKVTEDLLYLNKAFDSLESLKNSLEVTDDLNEQEKNDLNSIKEILEKVKDRIDSLNKQQFINNDNESGIIIHNIDPIRSVTLSTHEVFNLIIKRLETFFKENNLATIPFTPKNPALPTIDEQLAYSVSFFDALKNNTDQYAQQFGKLLTEAQSLDVTSIPDFSNDKDNTSKLLDPVYQEFKKHYDNAQELLRNCTLEIAHAESRNSMISSMQREMEGLQLFMNTSGYFLDPQKSSYFSLFITDGKVDGTKIKDFFKIPVNPTDVQLKSLGKQVLGFVGSKQVDTFTDQQKIDAGKLVYDALKNKTDILQLSLDEMICLAQMYEDHYKNDSGQVNAQANAARQTVYLLRTSGQLGWQEMQALINGQQDYGQINQGETLTNQLKNIQDFRTKLISLTVQTPGLIDEMHDRVDSIQVWLSKVQSLIVGQEYLEGNLKDQSVILSTEQIEDDWDISDIYGIDFAGTL